MEHLGTNQKQMKVDFNTQGRYQLEVRGHAEAMLFDGEIGPFLATASGWPYLSSFSVLADKRLLLDGEAGRVIVHISHRDQDQSPPRLGRIH